MNLPTKDPVIFSYKGMREFKDKFDPQWFNKYLIYDYDYDLIQVPTALSRVIKPV